jgi:hypothetical protein
MTDMTMTDATILADGTPAAQHRSQLEAHHRGRQSRGLAGPENLRHAAGDRSRRARLTTHPVGKTFASFDFTAAPELSKPHLGSRTAIISWCSAKAALARATLWRPSVMLSSMPESGSCSPLSKACALRRAR